MRKLTARGMKDMTFNLALAYVIGSIRIWKKVGFVIHYLVSVSLAYLTDLIDCLLTAFNLRIAKVIERLFNGLSSRSYSIRHNI